jgi:hypothetical protein
VLCVGVVGLASYSLLLNASGDSAGATVAWNNARRFVGNWMTMASGGDHYKLQYDLARDTWSLKYNLLFQKVLGMDLFPDSGKLPVLLLQYSLPLPSLSSLE